MDIRFLHGIILKKQRLSKGTSRLLIISHEEGKLTAFTKEQSKRAFILFEGGYYLMGASFSNNAVAIKEWELIEEFVNPHQLSLISSLQDIVERYLPYQTGERYFPLILSALRRTRSEKELVKNFVWLMAIIAEREGLGRIIPAEKEKNFILHRKIDEKTLQEAFKKALKIRKEMTR